jgi:cell division septal protein FtsQ
VDRDFPDTLRVRVTEYEPALYAYAGKRWYVVSAEGHVICEQTAPPKKQKEEEDATASTAVGDAATTDATSTDAATADATTATSLEATSVAGAPAPTDKEARLLETLAAGPPGATFDLPRMAVEDGLKPGAATEDRGVRAALALLSGLPASMPAKIAVVEADGAQLSLRFAGGPVVTWGDSSRSLAKTMALRAVLDRYAQAGETCVYMDVSVPDRVLARPVLK